MYHPGGTPKGVCQGTVFLWTHNAGCLAPDTVRNLMCSARLCPPLDIVQHRTYPSPWRGDLDLAAEARADFLLGYYTPWRRLPQGLKGLQGCCIP